MTQAVYDQTRVDITAGEAVFRATGNVMKFPGFTAAYEETAEKKKPTKLVRTPEKMRTSGFLSFLKKTLFLF